MKIKKKDLIGRFIRKKVDGKSAYGKISQQVGEKWKIVYFDGHEEEVTDEDIAKYYWSGIIPLFKEKEVKVETVETVKTDLLKKEQVQKHLVRLEPVTVLEKRKLSNSDEEEVLFEDFNSKKVSKKKRWTKTKRSKGCNPLKTKVENQLIGRFIRKQYDEQYFIGLICKYDGEYFSVVYEDADYEDMEESEVKELLWKAYIPESKKTRCRYFANQFEMTPDEYTAKIEDDTIVEPAKVEENERSDDL